MLELEHHSIFLVLLAILIVISANVFIITKILKKLRIVEQDKRVRRSFARHNFFVKCYDYTHRVIPKINLKNKKKEQLVKLFLTIKIQNLNDCMAAYYPEKTCDHEEVMLAINAAIRKTYRESIAHGIPKLFLDKYEVWFQDNYATIVKWSESICTSTFFESEEDKYEAFLDLMNAVLAKTIRDVEDTMNSFNGELENLLDDFDK